MSGPPAAVAAVVAAWPEAAQARFATLRALILAGNEGIAQNLKWGEPAFRPQGARQGATLRLCWKPARPSEIGLFVNCRTDLAERMRQSHPQAFRYEAERALWLALDAPVPARAVAHCAAMAFHYHQR